MRIKYLFLLASAFSLTLISCGNEESSSANSTTNDSTTSQTTNNNSSDSSGPYTIRWLNYDGTVLETDSNVSSPVIPSYDGDEPFKPSNYEGYFTFSGWVLASDSSNEKTYVAQFTKIEYPFNKSNENNYEILIGKDGVYDFLGKQIITPEQYNNLPVTSIGIEYNYSIKSIKCSKMIYHIDLYCCLSLEEILLDDNTDFNKFRISISKCDKLKYNQYDNGYYLGSEKNPYLVFVKTTRNDITSLKINANCKYINSIQASTINSLKFDGTVEQWNSLTKPNSSSYSWNINANEVICSDGNVSL